MSVNQGRVMDVHEIVNKLQNQATGRRNGEGPAGNIDIEQNGVYDVTDYAQATVQVPNTYAAGDEGKVVSGGALVSQTGRTVNENGSYDTTLNNSMTVQVPNTYTSGDEGKVVSNGALVAQSSDTVTQNGTVDTTLINSLTVNVSGGGGISIDDIATNTAPSGAVTLGSSVTSIADYAFYNKPITSISGANVTSISENALQGTQIASITDAHFPSLGVTDNYTVLLKMSNLVNIKLTGAKIRLSSGSGALRGNTKLETAEFPNAASGMTTNNNVGAYALGGCTKLTLCDIGLCRSIGANAFNGATILNILILRYTDVVALSNISAFTNTPFKSGGTGGHIYIPKTLYDKLGTGTDDYKAEANWSTVDGYGTITWHPIEGSIYEL